MNPKVGRKAADVRKEHKTFNFPVLATKVIDEDKGIVEELVAVFGNIDYGKDRIFPGAFKKTINEGIPSLLVLDAHNTDSIFRTLGTCTALREVSRNELPPEVRSKFPDATGGLIATTQYLLETPEGKGAFARIKSGAIKQRSIGFEVQDQDFEQVKARKVETGFELDKSGEQMTIRNLRTIRLMEYSPVLWGMNAATATVSAKDKDGEPAASADADSSVPSQDAPASEDAKALERAEHGATEKGSDEKDLTPFGPVRRMGEAIVGNCESMCGAMVGGWLSQGMLSMSEHAQLEEAMSQAMNTFAQACPQELMNRELSTNGYYTFGLMGQSIVVVQHEYKAAAASEAPEEKAGRVLSAANATRLKEAYQQLTDVLKAAGWLDMPDDDGDEKSKQNSNSSASSQSDEKQTETGAGQNVKTTPTPLVTLDYVQARRKQLLGVGG